MRLSNEGQSRLSRISIKESSKNNHFRGKKVCPETISSSTRGLSSEKCPYLDPGSDNTGRRCFSEIFLWKKRNTNMAISYKYTYRSLGTSSWQLFGPTWHCPLRPSALRPWDPRNNAVIGKSIQFHREIKKFTQKSTWVLLRLLWPNKVIKQGLKLY